MKLITYAIVGLALGLAGCAEKKQAEPSAEDSAAAAALEAPAVELDSMGSSAFIEHMHHHASQLSQLKAALELGSLAAAQRPAYWLAGHDEVSGIPPGWQVFIDGMRNGAEAVDSARDIDEARAGAQQIEASCVGCHTAAGLEIPDLQIN
ncbi:MAG: hypothetical protein WBN07_05785 [Woeseiaceae bacterium]